MLLIAVLANVICSQSAIDTLSARVLPTGTLNRAFLSLQSFSAVLVHTCAHKDATRRLPLT